MDPFIGQVIMFAGNFAPRGWAFCDGQLLQINTNQALFSILGTTYGGDGRTTFGLPDLRGRAPIHAGSGSGPGLSSKVLGQKGGSETHTLTTQNLPAHTHTVPAQTAAIKTSTSAASESEPAANFVLGAATIYSDTDSNETIGGVNVAASTTSSTGSSTQVNNMPPYLAINYIIALVGTFPSRN